ncbi:MAG: B12-binding domain-containing radical SAM protein, partial [Clostridia bacterium]|nr:B12-binding domain-containing radical SAM protein [Clostridia bacterium]
MKTIADYLDEEILALVEKPAQYIGGELNSYHKEWDKARCKMVFCFPDFYEIGMSHLGLRLLYEAVNREEDLLMERSFAVMPDMEELLRSHD